MPYTSGPWIVRDAPWGWDIFAPFFGESPPQWIGHIHSGPGPSRSEQERLGMYPDRATCEANARLIAAAPDLLKALCAVSGDAAYHLKKHRPHVLEIVEVAIAKAKGTST